MSAQHTPAKEWRVFIHGVGDIGSVMETNEANARCAALGKFGDRADSERSASNAPVIYLDDDFDVRPV